MRALAEDNDVSVHVYMKSSQNAENNMEKGHAEYLNQQQAKRLSLRADQRQDVNSQLEKGDKLMFDARGKGGAIAALSISGDVQCLDPALFSFHTQSETSPRFDVCFCYSSGL